MESISRSSSGETLEKSDIVDKKDNRSGSRENLGKMDRSPPRFPNLINFVKSDFAFAYHPANANPDALVEHRFSKSPRIVVSPVAGLDSEQTGLERSNSGIFHKKIPLKSNHTPLDNSPKTSPNLTPRQSEVGVRVTTSSSALRKNQSLSTSDSSPTTTPQSLSPRDHIGRGRGPLGSSSEGNSPNPLIRNRRQRSGSPLTTKNEPKENDQKIAGRSSSEEFRQREQSTRNPVMRPNSAESKAEINQEEMSSLDLDESIDLMPTGGQLNLQAEDDFGSSIRRSPSGTLFGHLRMEEPHVAPSSNPFLRVFRNEATGSHATLERWGYNFINASIRQTLTVGIPTYTRAPLMMLCAYLMADLPPEVQRMIGIALGTSPILLNLIGYAGDKYAARHMVKVVQDFCADLETKVPMTISFNDRTKIIQLFEKRNPTIASKREDISESDMTRSLLSETKSLTPTLVDESTVKAFVDILRKYVGEAYVKNNEAEITKLAQGLRQDLSEFHPRSRESKTKLDMMGKFCESLQEKVILQLPEVEKREIIEIFKGTEEDYPEELDDLLKQYVSQYSKNKAKIQAKVRELKEALGKEYWDTTSSNLSRLLLSAAVAGALYGADQADLMGELAPTLAGIFCYCAERDLGQSFLLLKDNVRQFYFGTALLSGLCYFFLQAGSTTYNTLYTSPSGASAVNFTFNYSEVAGNDMQRAAGNSFIEILDVLILAGVQCYMAKQRLVLTLQTQWPTSKQLAQTFTGSFTARWTLFAFDIMVVASIMKRINITSNPLEAMFWVYALLNGIFEGGALALGYAAFLDIATRTGWFFGDKSLAQNQGVLIR